jgi:hypothetical protein
MIYLVTLLTIFNFVGCNTGIESSPDPGILKITLQSDPADTVIIIVNDTITVGEDDEFIISIYQGRSFADSTYGILYPEIESYRQEERYYNLIERENNQYVQFNMFESHLPPMSYDQIEFGIDSEYLKLQNFDQINVITPPSYFITLPLNFEIEENRTTEVNVQVSPFKYITRYRDTYIFQPEMEIIAVTMH